MVNNDCKIAVLLNAYKRTAYLETQLDALDRQTIKPMGIYVWQNAGEVIPERLKSRFVLAECSENLGVWARLAFALNLDADYIAMFDDDTIPGPRWLENCLATLEKTEGLLGTRGLRFLTQHRYYPYESFGWDNPNPETERVDIVGHAWFFRRAYLAHFWSELPPRDWSKTSGEDMHFSYTLQKAGIGTFVPPHPPENHDLWGSLPEYGRKFGADNASISQSIESLSKFDRVVQYYVSRGFKLQLGLADRLKRGVAVGSGVRKNRLLRKIMESNPSIKKFARWLLYKLESFGIYI